MEYLLMFYMTSKILILNPLSSCGEWRPRLLSPRVHVPKSPASLLALTSASPRQNKSSETRTIKAVLHANSMYYTGIKALDIVREPVEFTLAGGQSEWGGGAEGRDSVRREQVGPRKDWGGRVGKCRYITLGVVGMVLTKDKCPMGRKRANIVDLICFSK